MVDRGLRHVGGLEFHLAESRIMTERENKAGLRAVAAVVVLSVAAVLLPHAVSAATGGKSGGGVHESVSALDVGGESPAWTATYPARPDGATCDRVSSSTIGAREYHCDDTGVTVVTVPKSGVADPAETARRTLRSRLWAEPEGGAQVPVELLPEDAAPGLGARVWRSDVVDYGDDSHMVLLLARDAEARGPVAPPADGADAQPANAEAIAVLLTGSPEEIVAESAHLLSTVRAESKEGTR